MSILQTIGSRIVLEGFAKYIDQLAKAERETKGFGGAVEGQSKTASTAFSKFTTQTGLGALGAATAISGIGLASIKLAADFDSTMSRIAGLTSTPAGAIDELRTQILKLSTEVAISPNELGAGAYFILSSGITDTATAMKVLELSSKAAVAGLGETQTIASTVTSIMNAYGFSIDEAERATNALVNTVKLGKGEPAELAQALGFVIPFASQLGVEIEEVGGVIATLTNVGLGAENAVTALKNVFTSLLSPTDQQRDAFARLGLSVEVFRDRIREDAGGALADLVKRASEGSAVLSELGLDIDQLSNITRDAIDRIRSKPKEVASAFDELSVATGLTKDRMAELLGLPLDALNNLTADEAIKQIVTLQGSLAGAEGTLAQLFPDVRSLTGVLGAFGVQADATARNIQGMKDGTDALDVAFKAAEKTAAFKFKQALISVQAAMIQLGAVALPVVAKIATGVSKMIGVFIKLPGPVKVAVVIGGALAAAFLTLAGAALILAPGIIALATAFTGTGVAAGVLGAGLVPLLIIPLAIAAALVALVAGAILLEKKFQFFSQTVLPALSSAFQAVAAVVGPVMQRALTQLTQLWTGLQPALSAAGGALVAVGKVLLDVAGFLKEHPVLLGAIAVALGLVFAPLVATAVAFAALPVAIAAVVAAGVAFLAFWDDIRRVVSNALDVLRELPVIGAIIQGVVAGAAVQLDFLIGFFDRFIQSVSTIISVFKDLLQGDFGAAFDGLKKLVGLAVENAIAAFLQPFRQLKAQLLPVLSEIGPLILSGLEALPGLVGKAGELIGRAIIGGIVAGARAAWAVHEFIPEIPGLIVGLIGDLGGLLVDVGRKAIGGLIKGAKEALAGAAGFLSDLPSLLFGGGDGGDGSAVGASLSAQITAGLKGLPALLFAIGKDALEALGNGILAAARDLPGLLVSAGEATIRGFVAGAEGAWAAFGDFFYGLPQLIVAAIGELPKLLVAAGAGLIDGLVAAAEGAWAVHDFLPRLPGLILSAVGDLAGLLVKGGKALIDGLVTAVTKGGPALLSAAKDLPGLILEGIKREIRGLKRISSLLLNIGEALIEGLLDGIKAGVPALINFVEDLPARTVRGLKKEARLFYSVGSFLIEQLGSGVGAAIPAVIGFISALPGQIVSALGGLASLLVTVGYAVIRGFATAVSAAWEAADDFFYGLPDLVLTALGDLAGLLLDVGKGLIEGLFSGVTTLWDREKAFFSDLPGAVIGLIGNVSRTLYQLGDDILAGLLDGVKFAYDRGKRFFSDLPGNIISLLGDVSLSLLGVGTSLINGLIAGASSALTSSARFWGGVAGTIKRFLNFALDIAGGAAGLVIDIGKSVIEGIINGIKSAIPNLKQTVEKVAKDIVDFMKNPLGIFSPSTVMADVGADIMAGVDAGINSGLSTSAGVAANAAATVVGGFVSGVDAQQQSLLLKAQQIVTDFAQNEIDTAANAEVQAKLEELGAILANPSVTDGAKRQAAAALRDDIQEILASAAAQSKSLSINVIPTFNAPGGPTLYDVLADAAKPKQRGDKSFAGGLALVGEAGRELAELPTGQIAMLGQRGQQAVNLPRGTRIYPHSETEQIMQAVPHLQGGAGFNLPGGGRLADILRLLRRGSFNRGFGLADVLRAAFGLGPKQSNVLEESSAKQAAAAQPRRTATAFTQLPRLQANLEQAPGLLSMLHAPGLLTRSVNRDILGSWLGRLARDSRGIQPADGTRMLLQFPQGVATRITQLAQSLFGGAGLDLLPKALGGRPQFVVKALVNAMSAVARAPATATGTRSLPVGARLFGGGSLQAIRGATMRMFTAFGTRDEEDVIGKAVTLLRAGFDNVLRLPEVVPGAIVGAIEATQGNLRTLPPTQFIESLIRELGEQAKSVTDDTPLVIGSLGDTVRGIAPQLPAIAESTHAEESTIATILGVMQKHAGLFDQIGGTPTGMIISNALEAFVEELHDARPGGRSDAADEVIKRLSEAIDVKKSNSRIALSTSELEGRLESILGTVELRSFAKGGFVPAGKQVNAVLHGPEAIIPLSQMGDITILAALLSKAVTVLGAIYGDIHRVASGLLNPLGRNLLPSVLGSSNLQLASFDQGGYVPAGQTVAAMLHGPELVTRGSLQASVPGITVNAPVSITINEMNWARVRSVALSALDEALSGARSTAVRQGVPLSGGIA